MIITVIMLVIITICIVQSTNIYSWQPKMTTIIVIIIICDSMRMRYGSVNELSFIYKLSPLLGCIC